MTSEATPAGEQSAEEVVSFKGALTVLDPIETVLNDARTKYQNAVFDLTTTKGDKEARQARAELVRIRTSADKAYSEWNKPVLEQQRLAREKVKFIKDEVEKLEKPIDEQIAADEARREAERKAKAEAEAARVKIIRDRIAVIAGLPLAVINMSSTQISAVIADLGAMPINEERFAEFLEEAVALVDQMKVKLTEVRDSVLDREQEAARLEAERKAIEEARAEQEALAAAERERIAAQQRELDEARQRQEEEARKAQILAEEQRRQAADKAARDAADAAAQLKAQQDAFAAERAEAERVLREEQDRLNAEREAVRKQEAELRERKRAEAEEVERAARAAEEAARPAPAAEQTVVQPVRETVDAEPAAELPGRPSDADILRVMANAYKVSEVVALDWLMSMDLRKLSVDMQVPF